VYNEISSYYKDRASNYEKKWNLVYLLLKEDYNPWINSATILSRSISNLSSGNVTDKKIQHILYILSAYSTVIGCAL
jgi:hypothetical protein